MKKLKENKLSVTMKEALARNSLAENKMKASMDAMSCDSKKSLQSLEHYKQRYEKRQRELQNEKHRMLSRRPSDEETGPRKISAPACMVTVVEYKDRPTGGFITDLQRIPSARSRSQRSYSTDGKLPSLYGNENGMKSSEPAVNGKPGGLTLPAIGLQRRFSATSLTGPLSPSLVVPTTPNNSQTSSAPSSPCATRRELARPSSARIRSKSPSIDLDGIFSLLNKVKEKQVPDLNEAMAIAKERRLEQERSAEEAEKEENLVKKSSASPEEDEDVPKNRKISGPGTVLPSSPVSERPVTNGDDATTLEERFDEVKYCQYLRSPSLPEEDEKLPNELIPKALIVGHTQWMPGD